MLNVKTNRNCVYRTAYHLIWCPKYRKPVLQGMVADTLSIAIDNLCRENGWDVLAKEIQPDHVHLFVSIPPSCAVSNAVKILKGSSARMLFTQYPDLRASLWGGHLWSPSYFVGTAGDVSAEVVLKYIERAEHVNTRR